MSTTLIISREGSPDMTYAADVALELAKNGGNVILRRIAPDGLEADPATEIAKFDAQLSSETQAMPWADDECAERINEIKTHLK